MGVGTWALSFSVQELVLSRYGLLTTMAYGLWAGTTCALEGSIAISGAALQWLCDNLGLIANAADP